MWGAPLLCLLGKGATLKAEEEGGAAGGEPAKRLPARDLILIPMLVVATILALSLAAEVSARVTWPQQLSDSCRVWKGKISIFRQYCHSRLKVAEGPWFDYDYNDCGYRSASPCRQKAAGGLRVVLLGSSTTRGYPLPYKDSFASRVETDLTRACRRPVDFQNIGLDEALGPTWHTLPDRMDEALKLRPDTLVIALSPFDMLQYSAIPPREPPLAETFVPASYPAPPRKSGLMNWLNERDLTHSYVFFAAEHFVYTDPKRYIPLFLSHRDQADFLRPPFTDIWKTRLHIVDMTLRPMIERAGQAKIPVIVVFVPSRAQAILSSWKDRPKGIDPFALGLAVGDIVRRDGGIFVDLTQTTRTQPNVSDDYFPVDTHPKAAAHALIAKDVAGALTGNVPAFAGCAARPRAENVAVLD